MIESEELINAYVKIYEDSFGSGKYDSSIMDYIFDSMDWADEPPKKKMIPYSKAFEGYIDGNKQS